MTTQKNSLGNLKNSSPVYIPQSKTMIRYAKPKPFEYNANNKNSIREKPPKINQESENEYKELSIPFKAMDERSQYEFDQNILYKSDGSLCSEARSGHSIGVQAQSFNLSASIQADGTEIDIEAQRQSYETSNKLNEELNKSIQAEEPWKNEDIQWDFSQISEGIQIDLDNTSQNEPAIKSQNVQVDFTERESSIKSSNATSNNEIRIDFSWQFSYKSDVQVEGSNYL